MTAPEDLCCRGRTCPRCRRSGSPALRSYDAPEDDWLEGGCFCDVE